MVDRFDVAALSRMQGRSRDQERGTADGGFQSTCRGLDVGRLGLGRLSGQRGSTAVDRALLWTQEEDKRFSVDGAVVVMH